MPLHTTLYRRCASLLPVNIMRNCVIGFMILSGLSQAQAQETFFLLAPNKAQKRIVCLALNDDGERVSTTQVRTIELPFAPAEVTLQTTSANESRLYATSSGRDEAQIASMQVSRDGQLKLIEASSLGHSSGYTSLDRGGNFFLTANYFSGLVSVHKIKVSGAVGELVRSIKTPTREAHCILTTPDNRFAYVPCVKNNNALYQFAFDQNSGKLTPLNPFNAKPPAMFGPRHYVCHPTLPLVYFSNEQQLGVSVFRIGDDGQLQDIQHAATIPRRSPFEQGKRDLHASDLAVSADGKRLFVAVRDFNGDQDSVFGFAIGDEGKLSLSSRTPVGDIPWKIDLSPSGKLLLVSQTGEKNLGVYRIAPADENGKQKSEVLQQVGRFDWQVSVRDFVVLQK